MYELVLPCLVPLFPALLLARRPCQFEDVDYDDLRISVHPHIAFRPSPSHRRQTLSRGPRNRHQMILHVISQVS
ncbi:hypothetical protein ARMSODRAFT_954235 [Armillaria solidipes]|uniref:Uncharacterized protein n=1 Tax=Armillaria solidipes TaxID=1076256 RepID=A0A2H3BSC8_9AGAR|nr:hypothetical protein ARMSODRAFT_954235 [Armillaria solidipes]